MSLQLIVDSIIHVSIPRNTRRYIITFDPANLSVIDLYEHSSAPADRFGLVPIFVLQEAVEHDLLHPREEVFWRDYLETRTHNRIEGEVKQRLEHFIKTHLSVEFPKGTYSMYGSFTLFIKSLGSQSRLSTRPFTLKAELAPIHGDKSISIRSDGLGTR